MVNISRRKTQGGHEVLGFEIRHFLENLSRGKPGREEIENVTDANTHPPNAWPASTLFGIDRDSIGELIHHSAGILTRVPLISSPPLRLSASPREPVSLRVTRKIGITSALVMLRQHATA